MTKMNGLIFLIFSIVGLGCNSVYTAKDKGYYKLDFPEKQYQVFNDPAYPFSFEYPVYARIAKDTSFFESSSANSDWVNILFPQFNGKIFISYKKIGGNSVYKVKNGKGGYRDSIGTNDFDKMVNDAFNLTYKNDIKAASIEDSLMETSQGITGIFFNLSGNVATANQFFLSDTTQHFLRGALYFNATPNEDSLRPVNEFLKQDMKHLINTLKFENE